MIGTPGVFLLSNIGVPNTEFYEGPDIRYCTPTIFREALGACGVLPTDTVFTAVCKILRRCWQTYAVGVATSAGDNVDIEITPVCESAYTNWPAFIPRKAGFDWLWFQTYPPLSECTFGRFYLVAVRACMNAYLNVVQENNTFPRTGSHPALWTTPVGVDFFQAQMLYHVLTLGNDDLATDFSTLNYSPTAVPSMIPLIPSASMMPSIYPGEDLSNSADALHGVRAHLAGFDENW